MVKVKVFVHAANADTDADSRANDISSPDIRPGSLKIDAPEFHSGGIMTNDLGCLRYSIL